MLRICNIYFEDRCELLAASEEVILDKLRTNHVILIPYDKDFNYEPSIYQGKKSHWAILVGRLQVQITYIYIYD